MAKLYSKFTQINHLNPKEETVDFLLKYSKALSVLNGSKTKFEILLN